MKKREYLTIANILSLIRIFFVAPIFYYISIDSNNMALIYIGIAALTDLLDGFFARKFNQITTVGKIIDPLADKICTGGAFIALYLYQNFPLWIALVIILRDLLIVFGSIFLFGQKRLVTPSNIPGKITVMTIAILGISYILKFEIIILPLTIITILMILLSGLKYLNVFFKNYFITTVD